MIKAFLPAVVSASLLLTACGGESNSTSSASASPGGNQSPGAEQVVGKQMNLNLNFAQLQSSGLEADKVLVTVTKSDFSKTTEVALENYSASAAFNDLLIGDYQISVQVFNGEVLVAEGSGSGTVSANTITTVDLSLDLNTGNLIVNVCVPELQPNSQDGWFKTKIMLRTDSQKYQNLLLDEESTEVVNYHSNLPFRQFGINEEFIIELSMSNSWSGIPNTEYAAESISAYNSIIVYKGDEVLIEKSGCNVKISYDYKAEPLLSYGEHEKAPEFSISFPVVGNESLINQNGSALVGTNGEPISRDVQDMTMKFRFHSGKIGTGIYRDFNPSIPSPPIVPLFTGFGIFGGGVLTTVHIETDPVFSGPVLIGNEEVAIKNVFPFVSDALNATLLEYHEPQDSL